MGTFGVEEIPLQRRTLGIGTARLGLYAAVGQKQHGATILKVERVYTFDAQAMSRTMYGQAVTRGEQGQQLRYER